MDNGSKVEIPVIGKQTMSTQRDDRKGAGLGLLAKLGLGGGAASGGAGGLSVGGGLLAGKAGVVALILAGSSVAAGIGMLTMGGGNANAPHAGATLFARAEGEAAPADSAAGAQVAAQAASAENVSGSLDNFNSANKGAVVDPYAPAKTEEASNPAAEQPKDSPSAVPDHTTTQSAGTTPPAAAPAPRMVKAAGFGAGGGAGGGSGASGGGLVARGPGAGAKSNVAGAALAGSSALRGGGIRSAAGAQRSAIMRGGGGAAGQLRAHAGALRGNLASGNVSSAGSGAVMDGAGAAGNIGGGASGIAGGGAGSGGKGIDSSPGASVSKNLKDVSPPPAPIEKGKNVTSYQKEMMMAMGASMAAMALIFISGMISDKAKAAMAASQPWVAAPLFAKAKNLAMAATALAAVATGIGIWLMMQKGQMMQGAMIAAVGGIMTFQAARAWMTGSEASAKAEAESTGAANKLAGESATKLHGPVQSVNSEGLATFKDGSTAMMKAPPSAAPGAQTGTSLADSGWKMTDYKPAPKPVAGK